MKQRSHFRPSHLVALATVAGLAGCQLVAGLGGITPNDTSSSGHGGGTGAASATSNGPGGTTASSGGSCGGSGGAGGFVCESLATFDDGPMVAPGALGIDATGAGYVSALAKGTSQSGVCAPGFVCPFIHRFDAHGTPMQSAMFTRMGGAVTLDGLGVMQSGVAFAGTIGGTGALLSFGGVTVASSSDGALYVAAAKANLSKLLWSRQLDVAEDPLAAIRVAVDSSNNIRVAGNVTSGMPFAWSGCSDVGGSGDEDVFLATLEPSSGTCSAMKAFGGLGDQTVDLLRVVPDGHALVAGTYATGIKFPSLQSLPAPMGATAAYYAYFDDNEMDKWRTYLDGSTVRIVGGSVSPTQKYAAVSGYFAHGTPPPQLTMTVMCTGAPFSTQTGFVQTLSGIDTASPTVGVSICFGATGTTSINDVVIDDDGNIVVAGVTDGALHFSTFNFAASSGNNAFFLMKFDKHGEILWARGSDPTVHQELHHLAAANDGAVASGFFAGNLDLGCACHASATDAVDTFAAFIGP